MNFKKHIIAILLTVGLLLCFDFLFSGIFTASWAAYHGTLNVPLDVVGRLRSYVPFATIYFTIGVLFKVKRVFKLWWPL
jgi:hypothetical protein